MKNILHAWYENVEEGSYIFFNFFKIFSQSIFYKLPYAKNNTSKKTITSKLRKIILPAYHQNKDQGQQYL